MAKRREAAPAPPEGYARLGPKELVRLHNGLKDLAYLVRRMGSHRMGWRIDFLPDTLPGETIYIRTVTIVATTKEHEDQGSS